VVGGVEKRLLEARQVLMVAEADAESEVQIEWARRRLLLIPFSLFSTPIKTLPDDTYLEYFLRSVGMFHLLSTRVSLAVGSLPQVS